jgi:hypothetical protein
VDLVSFFSSPFFPYFFFFLGGEGEGERGGERRESKKANDIIVWHVRSEKHTQRV